MCDIYVAKCPKCGVETEMHLSDYDTDRNEVQVFCESHLPNDRRRGVLWRYRDGETQRVASVGGWKKVFVKALTKNARDNADGNHPNAFDLEKVACPNGTLTVNDEGENHIKKGKVEK